MLAVSPAWLGTLPSWLSFGGIAAILGLVVKLQLGLKKVSVEAQQVEVNARKVANDDAADQRDHYDNLINSLSQRLDAKDEAIWHLEKHWRELSEQADRRYEECVRERDEDRAEINFLKNEIQGLIRIIVQASADKVISLGEGVSTQIREMAERIQGAAPTFGKAEP